MEKPKKLLIGAAGVGVTGLGILEYFGNIDPETIGKFVSATASSQIAQMLMCFSIAAVIHSGRVRKEIASNFSGLTTAINNLSHSLTIRLDNIEKRVETLETNKQGG